MEIRFSWDGFFWSAPREVADRASALIVLPTNVVIEVLIWQGIEPPIPMEILRREDLEKENLAATLEFTDGVLATFRPRIFVFDILIQAWEVVSAMRMLYYNKLRSLTFCQFLLADKTSVSFLQPEGERLFIELLENRNHYFHILSPDGEVI